MLLFRSEEHLERWLRLRRVTRGGTMSIEQQWELAIAWYGSRLDRDWRRKTPKEAQAVFTGLGLTGDFWSLGP